ncbi:MAG: glycosyl transferase family 1, partial [Candidatus Thermofonsia Clade 3 bacterium]
STALAPGLIAKARALHAERHYDLFHFHFPDPLTHLASALLPAEVPRVVTWHSDIVRQKAFLPLYAPWLRRFVQQVDAVIVSSPSMLQSSPFIARVAPARRHVIPCGLDYRHFLASEAQRRAADLRLSLGVAGPLVLAVGRLVYYKGYEFLIEAIAGLAEANLIIIGRGPLKRRLRGQAQALGCEKRVHLLQVDDDETLAAWYHACDVFCLPSVEPAETFGLVQLEAMACGKPVVSTRLGTGVEFVNQDGVTGIVVPPRDVDALRAALRRLLDDAQLRQSMGNAGRARAIESFSKEDMA